jgi:hypothetical protein
VRRQRSRLRFGRRQWARLLVELRRRGEGRRESGAFLLADAKRLGRVRKIVYLDDLDPECLTGSISLRGFAYSKLWALCRDGGLRVVGDIHTHPGLAVGQSPVDQENPMIGRAGHLALIAPSFAQGKIGPRNLGVHEFLGNGRWQSSFGREADKLVYVGWLP